MSPTPFPLFPFRKIEMKQADIINKKECICAMEMLVIANRGTFASDIIRANARDVIPMLAADVLNMADTSME